MAACSPASRRPLRQTSDKLKEIGDRFGARHRRRGGVGPGRRLGQRSRAGAAGEPLHRRGWRLHLSEAPLRETLAAACLAAAPDLKLVEVQREDLASIGRLLTLLRAAPADNQVSSPTARSPNRATARPSAESPCSPPAITNSPAAQQFPDSSRNAMYLDQDKENHCS